MILGNGKWFSPALRMSTTPTHLTPQRNNRNANEHFVCVCGSSLCSSPLSFIPFLFDCVRESDKFKREFWSLLEKRKRKLREFWSLLLKSRLSNLLKITHSAPLYSLCPPSNQQQTKGKQNKKDPHKIRGTVEERQHKERIIFMLFGAIAPRAGKLHLSLTKTAKTRGGAPKRDNNRGNKILRKSAFASKNPRLECLPGTRVMAPKMSLSKNRHFKRRPGI